MLELPETTTMAKQLSREVIGAAVKSVLPPTKEHKFCFFSGEPTDYGKTLTGREICSAEGFGIFAELGFSGGPRLSFNDGVNLRLLRAEGIPKNYQLALALTDGRALVFTVAMYGGVFLHDGGWENEYYYKSKNALSPFAPDFDGHYRKILGECKPNLSAKAFLATQQRFPGLGNGCLQDILFDARVHPKRKLGALGDAEREQMLASLKSVLADMTRLGGRDTERDLYGNSGGYATLMSKNALASGCPVCGGAVVKEAYLGGSVYYCPNCQPI